MNYKDRLEELRGKFRSRRLDCFLVSGRENLNYLSGFNGDNGWGLVTPDRAFLITDFRYREQAKEEVDSNFEIVEAERELIKSIGALCRKLKLCRIGFESWHVNYALYRKFKQELKGRRFKPQGPWVEQIRMVKSGEEIVLIRNSADLVTRVLAEVIASLRLGMTEREIANTITAKIREAGGQPAFEPIVAVGSHSSQPHALSSNRWLKGGEILLLDLGTRLNQYNSDLTRTLVVGNFPRRFRKLYQLVLKAQAGALAAIRPGVRAAAVDREARNCFEEQGYGCHFGHALGHGVGLQIHEDPRLSSSSDEILKAGMVFTVEPGIYLPGWGGIRIEDTVQVITEGCRVLTGAPKELEDTVIDLV